jgi:hypothetical protein
MSNDFISVVVPLLAFWFVIPMTLGARIAYNRGRSRGAAITLGFLFGWFGLLIVGCWRKDWDELRDRQAREAMAEAMMTDICKQIEEEKRMEPEPRRIVPMPRAQGRRRA